MFVHVWCVLEIVGVWGAYGVFITRHSSNFAWMSVVFAVLLLSTDPLG
jgi:hypothetical protein